MTDVFESPVEDLQLFLAEFGLLNETVESLRSVPHCCQFTLISYTSCTEERTEKRKFPPEIHFELLYPERRELKK